MGLALSKAFVEQGHGGRVGFESKPGQATEFFFDITFDLATQSSSSSEIVSTGTSASTTTTGAKVETTRQQYRSVETAERPQKVHCVDVLIVEDSAMSRRLVSKTLTALGVSSDTAVDGLEVCQ